ncbi:MAG: hypothetical protein LC118_08780 [Dehalococcoidia bacterium]|nr:hypothetical protein [Dehalococcoidia bacterium]
MSELQKKIARIMRREGPAIGFSARTRGTPRAMLLAATASTEAGARAAIEAGADVVVLRGDSAKTLAGMIGPLAKDKITTGAWIATLDEPAADALAEAGCDFVISTLDGTASAAVNTERMGQLLVASESFDDTTLRSLGPLGLDGLLIDRQDGAMTLKDQLALVRLASFSSTQLVVTVSASASVSDLRVLRDSGAVAVVAPEGAGAAELKALNEALRAVPAPKKGKESREIALVPSVASAHNGEEEGDDDDSRGE